MNTVAASLASHPQKERNQEMKKGLLLGLAVAVAAGLVAASAAQAAPRVVKITGTDDMKFSVTKIDAVAGEEIKVVLTVTGALPKEAMAHNFVLLNTGVDANAFTMMAISARATAYVPKNADDKVLAATGLAGAGETVEVTFKAPAKAGAYTYLCSFPGHFAAGMKGVLNVK
jgi:azurin